MGSIKRMWITPQYYEAAVKFANEQFRRNEPINRSLNLPETPGLDYFFRHSMQKGTSVMAVDTEKDDKIVGVRVTKVVKRNDPDDWNPPEDRIMAPIFKILHFAYSQFNPWNEFKQIDRLLDCQFVSVHQDYFGKNLAVSMMELVFDMMRREKIPLAYVVVTSKYSRAVMEKMGFEVVYEMQYKDYKVNGQQVFDPQPEHSGFAVMIKWMK